jgi:opacity protein-like surface antigen
MRFLKILIGLHFICALHAGSALAADWSGLYIGVNQATKTVTGDWTTTETRDSLGFETEPSSDPEAMFESEAPGDNSLRIGLIGNPGNWVFGLEAFEEAIRHEDSIDRIPGLGDPASDPASHVEFRAESEGVNLRLRAGYLALPQLLFYLTAGRPELEVEVTSTCSESDNVCDEGTPAHSNKRTLSATALGLGLEYQLYGFSLRAEYIEADYGEFSFTALPDQFTTSAGADATMAVKTELMQVGVSYQF